MLAGDKKDVAEKTVEEIAADACDELPEVEEDLEEVEEIDEAKEDAIVEEILEDLDKKEDNKNAEEPKTFGRGIVIDREMTAGIFESLGVKKKTKEEEENLFSDVEKNLQKTVESTVNEANE